MPLKGAVSMQIFKMTEGKSFDMGKGDTRCIIGPHTGSKYITFNYAVFEPHQAFTQHIHKNSEDVIIVLDGDGVIRLDDDEFPIEKGDVVYVAEGEYHGTVAGPNGLTACSCQAPIDYELYEGGNKP
jgi:quercetin dioxygenase-like cupin family protein